MITENDLHNAEIRINQKVFDQIGILFSKLKDKPPTPPKPKYIINPRDAHDVMNWPVTCKIKSLTVNNKQICIDHNCKNSWEILDDGVKLIGNVWVVVAGETGNAFMSTYEYIRPGQVCKSLGYERDRNIRLSYRILQHTKWEKLYPADFVNGKSIGFMVSTFARDSRRTTNERSDIHWIKWPEGC